MINLKRNERGITLIALIITIVVLLILAIVAIGQAQESNIVGYAQNAASRYEQAKTNETSKLQEVETLLETLNNGDLRERLRVAIEKQIFQKNDEDLYAILKEVNMKLEDIEKNMIALPVGIYGGENEEALVIILFINTTTYEYYIDEVNQKVTLLDVNHPNYPEIQKFKSDAIEIRNTFLDKNIEEFEQEKIDENYWKIKGVNILGQNEIIVRYYDSFTSGDGTFFEGYIKMDYIEGWGLDLTLENDSISSDNKLQGKIIAIGLDDGNI